MGFNRKGNMAVERVLSNPVYAGLLKVESYKEYAGGLFSGIYEPIINLLTWKIVQEKMKRSLKIKTVIDDNIPLRSVLKYHCGQPLSGAPSRGKAGRYYYYYKCKHSKHNNINLYNNEIKVLNTSIERLSANQNKAYKILEKNLNCLNDIRQIYSRANTIEKREFVNLVFNSNLYYENGIY